MRGIALVSQSKDPAVTFGVLDKIAKAVTRQLCEDYAGVWQSQGVPVVACQRETDVPAGFVPCIVFDTAPEVGILGYHDVTPEGRPYMRVFWKAIRDYGGSLTTGDDALSVTISHECIELVDDPYATAWQDMPDGKTEEAHEPCDRVEGDSYAIDGVSVSNFLGPRAFRGGDGPYDFLGIQGDPRGLTEPWEIRPTGYAIRRTGGPAGKTKSVFGAAYPTHKIEQKMAMGSRFAKRAGMLAATLPPTVPALEEDEETGERVATLADFGSVPDGNPTADGESS